MGARDSRCRPSAGSLIPIDGQDWVSSSWKEREPQVCFQCRKSLRLSSTLAVGGHDSYDLECLHALSILELLL
jgi:hypothetical protein